MPQRFLTGSHFAVTSLCCAMSAAFAFDRESEKFYALGQIIDTKTELKLDRVHDLCLSDERITYVAETNVPERSGYL